MAKGVLNLKGIIIVVIAVVVFWGGVFAWQYFAIKPQLKVAQTQVEIPTWKTYKNDKYGFELKYLPIGNHTNKFEDSSKDYFNGDIYVSGISFAPEEDGNNQVNWTIDVQDLKKKKCSDFIFEGDGAQDIVVGGVRGKRVDSVVKYDDSVSDSPFYTITGICLEKGGFAYILSCTHWGKLDNYDYTNFNQMLSTFKFTKITEQISEQDAINAVRNLSDVKDWLALFNKPNGTSSIGGKPIIEIGGYNSKIYMVHVYEVVPDDNKSTHTATFQWYDVDIKTGKITPEF